MYNNVKHAFYQPCDGEMIILLHFNLKVCAYSVFYFMGRAYIVHFTSKPVLIESFISRDYKHRFLHLNVCDYSVSFISMSVLIVYLPFQGMDLSCLFPSLLDNSSNNRGFPTHSIHVCMLVLTVKSCVVKRVDICNDCSVIAGIICSSDSL